MKYIVAVKFYGQVTIYEFSTKMDAEGFMDGMIETYPEAEVIIREESK